MNIPFTDHELVIRDVYETFISIIVVVFGVFGGAFIANKITNLIVPKNKDPLDKHINVLFLVFHLVIILCFVMIVRYYLAMIITNALILESSFSLIGPAVGLSSLYFGQTIKFLMGSVMYMTMN